MLNILNKFFSSTKNLNTINHRFIKLRKERNVAKIFDAIESYSNKAEIRYVGGCVRKIINNEKVDDIDLATNIDPTKVKEALKKKNINYFETGIEHGTITALIENDKFEITSLRSDIKTDGRHAEIEFTTDWIKDAERRDFTINSIYADINGNLFDPFDGKKDLENGLIKFVGEPERRIEEDYLRILRYFRFFALYSKNEHLTEIKKAIKKNIVGIKKLSSERLLDELKKIYKSNCFIKLCEVKFSYEIICAVFPEFKQIELFKKLNEYTKNNLHNLDFIFFLSLLVLDNTDNSDYFFYKFNISKKNQRRIKLIKEFYYSKKAPIKLNSQNLWKIFYFNGKEGLFDLLNYKIFTSKKFDKNLVNQINFFENKDVPKLSVTGNDLIKNFGIPEGQRVGEKLKEIENVWINNNFKISDKNIKKILEN
tara:strand:- start:29 stop:1303 length:1275 start_codon:yes stop_codon:yes gene_type:complete